MIWCVYFILYIYHVCVKLSIHKNCNRLNWKIDSSVGNRVSDSNHNLYRTVRISSIFYIIYLYRFWCIAGWTDYRMRIRINLPITWTPTYLTRCTYTVQYRQKSKTKDLFLGPHQSLNNSKKSLLWLTYLQTLIESRVVVHIQELWLDKASVASTYARRMSRVRSRVHSASWGQMQNEKIWTMGFESQRKVLVMLWCPLKSWYGLKTKIRRVHT